VADLALHTRQMVPGRTHDKQHPVLHFEQADNFVLAYYAGGAAQPKALPFTVEPRIEPEPGTLDSLRLQQNISGAGAVGIGGDQIDAQGAQGFINRPTGPVSQQFGDTVSGDKTSGNITLGDVSGSGIAIGHKARAQVQQSGDADAFDAFARAFAQVYQAISARPPDPNVGKDEITQTVRAIQEEAQQGAQANEKKLARWLRNLAGMAEDIFEVTVAALTGPHAAFATVARKVAAQARDRG
jgi:hypothetical protein